MQRFVVALGFIMLTIMAPGFCAQDGNAEARPTKDRALELIAAARAGLGGEAKLSSVQSLIVSGKMRRITPSMDQSGEIKIEMMMPDRYKKTETLSLLAGIELTLVTALNGEQAWRDSKTSSSNTQVMVMRPGGGQAQVQPQEVRAEFTRNLLALLLTAPASFPVQYKYAGEAQAPDGRADVIDVTGPNGFAVRIFLDKNSHRPLMLSYRGSAAPMSTIKTQVDSKEDIDKVVKDAQAKVQREQAEIQIRYADYRIEAGIMLPHRVTKAVNGQVSEEWELTKFKLNPSGLKPERFQKP